MSAKSKAPYRTEFVNDWAYQEELGRWIDRATLELARLPVGSNERRVQELVIRRMEHQRLRHSLRWAQDRLSRLPRRSHERRQLERVISRMDEDYVREDREIRIAMENLPAAEAVAAREYEVDLERTLFEAREALSLAAVHLRSPSRQARRKEALAKVDRALARLDAYRRSGRA